MLGAHHAHVVAGMLLELWFVLRLTRGRDALPARRASVHDLYWYFVNAVALLVVALQLSPR